MIVMTLILPCMALSHRQMTLEPKQREPCRQKPWTILAFFNGDNNLEADLIDDINNMETAVDTTFYNAIVEMDRIPGYDNSNGDWTTTRDYYITYDPSGDRIIRSELLRDLGELNMGDPHVVIDFVEYCKTLFPADHYLLILCDHGNGWYDGAGSPDPLFRGIGYDWTDHDSIGVANGEYYFILDSLNNSLGEPLDILAHDACLMAMQEVAYEVNDFVDVIVFSEHWEPLDGYPYEDIFSWLNQNPNATPEQLATTIVEKYVESYQPGGSQYQTSISATHSALILGTPFEDLTQRVDLFAQDLIDAGGLYQTEISAARYYSQQYGNQRHIDLYDFAQRIKNTDNLPTSLRASADSVLAAFSNAVLAEGHYTVPYGMNVDSSHGIAIYYPTDTTYLNYDYASLCFVQDYPYWWHFLQGFTGVQERPVTAPSDQLQFSLLPNPASTQFTIQFSFPIRSDIIMTVYDALGKRINEIVCGVQNPGNHTLYWQGQNDAGNSVPSGVYFLKGRIGDYDITEKLLLIR